MLEAAYVKTPIVSTRCPSGQEEFLDYGKAGELCGIGNVKEMADCMHKVLMRTETGKVERAYNKSLNFTMERHGENLDKIIKGLKE
jgi:glycosyltransferase involved in cell wall biosynthesis